VLRPAGIGRNEGQVDLGLHRAGQFFLGFLRRLFQALEGHTVLAQVDTLFLAELVCQPVDNALVEVIATQMGITIGALDLKDAIA